MVAIPAPLHTVSAAVYRHHEELAEQEHRAHLGASLLGHECSRYLWLTFRWAGRERFPGRMLRLFETGKLEEARVIAELRAIGCEIDGADGEQIRVTFARGHGGGSLDGMILKGVPEAPRSKHVLEVKTMNQKNFEGLVKAGVEASNPKHFVQMQIYMRLTGVERSLYFVVNKTTDEIYTERVRLDKVKADAAIDRATNIIAMSKPPQRISERPEWYQCKFCHFHGQCHGMDRPEANCRTCAHSTPIEDGKWSCARADNAEIPEDVVRTGCEDHRFIPALLRWAIVVDASEEENWVEYEHDGRVFRNGPKGPNSYSSQELAGLDPSLLDNIHIEIIRRDFDGTIQNCC